jgi:hypothetical protein
MRAVLLAHLNAGGEGLNPQVRYAAEQLYHEESETLKGQC